MFIPKELYSHYLAILLGTSILIASCNKDDSPVIDNSDLIGKWESTTFQVSECSRVQDNVELRSCGLSDLDDVDCGIMEFRSDGTVMQDSGGPSEAALSYARDQDTLTLTNSQSKETIAFRMEVSANTLTLYHEEFNGQGCFLTLNLVRVN
jgi:hypothetical protein